MSSSSSASFVRAVEENETTTDLVNECKALTWAEESEQAVLDLQDGRRVVVRGGKFGIDLDQVTPNDPFGRPDGSLWITVDGLWCRVVNLVPHVHPQPTGPSDDDLRVLALLGQTGSLLFEITGPAEGTMISPKK